MIQISPDQIVLVQADEQFLCPDGQWRQCVLGKASVIAAKEVFGFEPKHGTNWYVQVGFGDRAVIIAGCRVHYCQPFVSETSAAKLVAQTFVWDARS